MLADEISKDEEEDATNDFYMYKLEPTWYIDLYKNGNYKLIGDKQYYYNLHTLELYEKIDNEFVSVIDEPIVYNENKEEIF